MTLYAEGDHVLVNINDRHGNLVQSPATIHKLKVLMGGQYHGISVQWDDDGSRSLVGPEDILGHLAYPSEPCDCSCHHSSETKEHGVMVLDDETGEAERCCPCWPASLCYPTGRYGQDGRDYLHCGSIANPAGFCCEHGVWVGRHQPQKAES